MNNFDIRNKLVNFSKDSGMYVLSFNMERPMGYYRYRPQSNKYVDSNMIKVGKCINIRSRMTSYTKTYGYREFEPLPTIEYWKNQGYADNYLKKCFGCNLKSPHHHVNFEYIKETNFLEEQQRRFIETKVKEKFISSNIFGEYFDRSIKSELISFLDKLICKYKRNKT